MSISWIVHYSMKNLSDTIYKLNFYWQLRDVKTEYQIYIKNLSLKHDFIVNFQFNKGREILFSKVGIYQYFVVDNLFR